MKVIHLIGIHLYSLFLTSHLLFTLPITPLSSSSASLLTLVSLSTLPQLSDQELHSKPSPAFPPFRSLNILSNLTIDFDNTNSNNNKQTTEQLRETLVHRGHTFFSLSSANRIRLG